MLHHRHREVVDVALRLGQRVTSMQSNNPEGMPTEDVYRVVEVLAEERRRLAERDRLYEEALAIFVAELKHRGKTHEAIQRRMRRPGEKPNASEITRILRRWRSALEAGPDVALQNSALLAVVTSAALSEEHNATDSATSPEVRSLSQDRAEHLWRWSTLGHNTNSSDGTA